MDLTHYSDFAFTDEIQTGFGRTGKMFAVEHSGVVPDIMTFAKGVANGMPVSGIVTKKHIMDSMPSGSLVSL
jgi:4-aminobutyrate aminotransferase